MYNPIANQIKFNAIKILLCVDVSQSNAPKLDCSLKRLVIGVKIAEAVVLILKILRFFPDIYNMKAFIKIC